MHESTIGAHNDRSFQPHGMWARDSLTATHVTCSGDFGRWPSSSEVAAESAIRSMTASRRRFSQEFEEKLCQELISTSKPINRMSWPTSTRGRTPWISWWGNRRATCLATRRREDQVGAERMNVFASESADFDVALQFAKAPVRDGGALVGLVKLRDYAKFLRRPKSDAIRDEMFAVNVRDFAGETARVNAAISHTLATDDKSAFWWLNNGITIIADDATDPTETGWMGADQSANRKRPSNIECDSSQCRRRCNHQKAARAKLACPRDQGA
jgi:hypothetical protein